MLPITYYFWSSYKKSGYVRGKLDRNEYDKRVNKWWKDSNIFVKKLVDSVLEDQAKTVNDNITTLEIQYNNADKELKRIQSLKDEEENKTSITFSNKKQILEQEKSKIEEDFENNTLLEAQQLKWAKNILKNLLEFLQTYAEEVKKGVTNQWERLLQQRKSALKHNTKLTAQEIKENIIQKNDANNSQNEKWNNNLWRSLGYLIFLILMCIFDIILWYWVMYAIFLSQTWWTKLIFNLDIRIAASFSAIFFVIIAIWLIHFSSKDLWLWKNAKKQLWLFSIILVTIIISLYILQSSEALLKSIVWNELWGILYKDPEALIRALILPCLFAWEVIIELIDWDSILNYFWIWKRKWPNSLSKLITNWLYFLKSRKISSYAKEEKKAIDNLINEMQKEEIPAFNEIKKDIREIQSILDPIWDKQAEKQEEFNRKLTINKNKMDNNLKEYNTNIQEIEKKYAPEINRLEGIKRLNEIKINKLNHDLNQASIDVKEWILIWLIDK